MRRLIFACCLSLLISASAWGQDAVEPGGKDFFRAGLTFSASGRHEDAMKAFAQSAEKLPIVADYALYYKAQSALKSGDKAEAIKTAEELLGKFQRTPIKKQARALLVKAVAEEGKEGALSLLEQYARDYPDDWAMKYLYADALKKSGSPKQAKAVYEEIFASACSLSDKARKEFDDASAALLSRRAASLMKALRHKDAESDLREALAVCPSKDKTDILESLAVSLFRQKKYRESAETYLKAGNIHGATTSYLRAGEYKSFEETLAKLVSAGDKRAGALIVSYAGVKRRGGNTSEALKMLSEAGRKYPSEAQASLWQTGWTHYMGGLYAKADEVFAELSRAERDNKFIYWHARAREKAGQPAGHIYAEIGGSGDYYGLLASMRTGGAHVSRAGFKAVSAHGKENGATAPETFARADILQELGLRAEAVGEVLYSARELPSTTLPAAIRLRDMGEYRKAIALALALPEAERPWDILYPLAFWEHVGRASLDNSIDPYLILSVIREESRYDPSAVSIAGAIGVMQLMPDTAERLASGLGISLKGKADIFDPGMNIRLGTRYMAALLKEFGSAAPALASYNAGEIRVREWLKRSGYGSYDEFVEDIPYQETREYVKRIMTTYYRYKSMEAGASGMEAGESSMEAGASGMEAGASIAVPEDEAGAPESEARPDLFNLTGAYGIIRR